MLGEVAVALVILGDVDEPGPDVVRHAVARILLVGTGHAVARDGAEHDLGVDGPEVVVPESLAGEAPRSHGLDDSIRVSTEVPEDLLAGLGAQIERDRALAAVDVEVHQGGPLDDGPRHLPDVVALGWLDLADLSAEVDQEGRDLRRTEGGALDDAHAGERGGAGHGSSLVDPDVT